MEEKIRKFCPECGEYFPQEKIDLIKGIIESVENSLSCFNAIIDTHCQNCKSKIIVWKKITDPPKDLTMKIPV